MQDFRILLHNKTKTSIKVLNNLIKRWQNNKNRGLSKMNIEDSWKNRLNWRKIKRKQKILNLKLLS